MKYQLIFACIGILIVNFASCAETEPPVVNEASSTNLKVSPETSTVTTRTPLPANVRKDADGNLIKPDGWPIQEIIPHETRKRVETGKTKNGRTVIFDVLSITPQSRPVSEAVVPDESYYEWRISNVRELSGRDGKIFCYEYSANLFGRNSNANGFTTATSYRLCDYDEDGKFEFNGSSYKFKIPNWVETLPGDPAAVNSDANY